MVDVDGWLQRNTILCGCLGARLTLIQCVRNQEDAKQRQYPGLLKPCLTCDGGEIKVIAKGDEMGKSKHALCTVPGCTKIRVAKCGGMCTAHYKESIKVEQPVQEEIPDMLPVLIIEPEQVDIEEEIVCVPEPVRVLHHGRLLSNIETVPQSAGFFLDFTGNEGLLAEIGPVCPELNMEIMVLLRAAMDKRLVWKQ